MLFHKKQTYAALDGLRRIVKLFLTNSRPRVSPLSHTQTHTLGNYITVNGREPFMKAGGADEDELWSEVNNNERNMVHLEITEVGREPKAPEDSPNLLQT